MHMNLIGFLRGEVFLLVGFVILGTEAQNCPSRLEQRSAIPDPPRCARHGAIGSNFSPTSTAILPRAAAAGIA